ncbi:hypothetical protein [Stratiformator vulcanicus]|uniref:Uncharacterized protein n=1 Tax=Stratiformator vulcanicus TaxID=2527980 RepID=A0A517R689_9PLAN|nr:hypothetical protein [Stratiformator vulcanicus]QDT39353.1 hypothetical protein Pan189_37590 [Stratiformator vulcanicus]
MRLAFFFAITFLPWMFAGLAVGAMCYSLRRSIAVNIMRVPILIMTLTWTAYGINEYVAIAEPKTGGPGFSTTHQNLSTIFREVPRWHLRYGVPTLVLVASVTSVPFCYRDKESHRREPSLIEPRRSQSLFSDRPFDR